MSVGISHEGGFRIDTYGGEKKRQHDYRIRMFLSVAQNEHEA